ncbi:hypothetical protein CI109_102706 [Kwoniella shandongensis]|uniref:Uncharacterized protein n=1 Tax=Kwoniella shandongensis TaxID=1734106 RepID=A0A5M6C0N3_9TREE|nr:uncharacterized protein CI109_004972 [Kwoniella shandongensis]KAA5526769.1 hypothetical protein CI109_004972 [Kwoniella shandongensis]
MRVTVSEYDPTWPTTFQQLKADLLALLHPLPIVAIEHVGSTSVPGLAAKPIIDIDIVVEPAYIIQAFSALSRKGYTYSPENWGDRASFRWNGHTHDQGASRPTEDGLPRRMVYLNLPEGKELKKHLVLKRVLLQDDALRDEYAGVKRELAEKEHEHIGAYGSEKGNIIGRIYAKGEEMGETGSVYDKAA